jgi:hypothetical protein
VAQALCPLHWIVHAVAWEQSTLDLQLLSPHCTSHGMPAGHTTAEEQAFDTEQSTTHVSPRQLPFAHAATHSGVGAASGRTSTSTDGGPSVEASGGRIEASASEAAPPVTAASGVAPPARGPSAHPPPAHPPSRTGAPPLATPPLAAPSRPDGAPPSDASLATPPVDALPPAPLDSPPIRRFPPRKEASRDPLRTNTRRESRPAMICMGRGAAQPVALSVSPW